MKLIFVLSLSIICFGLRAQNTEDWKLFPDKNEVESHKMTTVDSSANVVRQKNPNRVGYVEIVQDQRIKKLVEKDQRINEEQKTIPGYRIQLFSGSGANVKTEANEMKANFLKLYESMPVYVFYDEPNWKTRVGDYRTKMEAEKFMMEIQEQFPNSFVVNDKINFPELDLVESN